jgi:hypothetical protein
MVHELEVLGHIINKSGTYPTPQHIQVIIEYPPPRTRNSCSATRGWSTSTAVLHKALQQSWNCSPPPSKELKRHYKWTPALNNAFQRSKQVLTVGVPLAHPTPNTTIDLVTDASNTTIGSALHQQVRGSWQQLGFFSPKLQHAELKYSTFDQDLLAAIKHFRHILEG